PTATAGASCSRQTTTSRPIQPPPPCKLPPQRWLSHHQAPGQGSPGGAPALFFEGAHHRRRAHPQHAGGITDAAAIERHVNDLPFDLRQPPGMVISHQEDPPLTVYVIASISLFAVSLPSISHDLTATALRTLHFDHSHTLSCSMGFAPRIILALSTLLVHYPLDNPFHRASTSYASREPFAMRARCASTRLYARICGS